MKTGESLNFASLNNMYGNNSLLYKSYNLEVLYLFMLKNSWITESSLCSKNQGNTVKVLESASFLSTEADGAR